MSVQTKMNSRSLMLFTRNARVFARSPALLRRAYLASRPVFSHGLNHGIRLHSSQSNNDKSATLKADDPQLMIAFTCKKCDTRSSHAFSRQSYYKGTVLIQCPGCKNRHLIADNLKIFRDNKVNLEDILKEQGQSVATTTDDLAFEDIPESLRGLIGHHAKDAPESYRKDESDTNKVHELPGPKKE